jgi:sugar lactone lactonase YvrE
VVRAGALGGGGTIDGTGEAARFSGPAGLAIDAAGNLFVADFGNSVIRKVTSTAAVSVFAGVMRVTGHDGGRLTRPRGLIMDAAGNLLVTDANAVRKVTPTGVITTIAGDVDTEGSLNATGVQARFRKPGALALDGAGNIFVADTGNHVIRKIAVNGVVSTIAGAAGLTGSDDGVGASARFNEPTGIVVDGAGNIFVADTNNFTIRKISAQGKVTTVAGKAAFYGTDDGTGENARFGFPKVLAFDRDGNLLVGDRYIRKVTAAGVVTTLAPAMAVFAGPLGIAVDSGGGIFFSSEQAIYKVNATGVTRVAGANETYNMMDGESNNARIAAPWGLTLDNFGNSFFADLSTIRKVTPTGSVLTLAGGNVGSKDGVGSQATFDYPRSVAMGGADLFVADTENDMIRKVTADGVVTTIAGQAGQNVGSKDGAVAVALFSFPWGIAADATGTIFVADTNEETIRRIKDGQVTTIAGAPKQRGSSDGNGSSARFDNPQDLALDQEGNLFVVDRSNRTIRKLTPTGTVTTVAGQPGAPQSVDGVGTAARFIDPVAVAVGPGGNLFVADHHTVRKIAPDGMVTTVVGIPGQIGVRPGPLPGSLNFIRGIAVTPNGNLVLLSEGAVLDVTLP